MTGTGSGAVRSKDGTRIGFAYLGAGPPLVAVHGGTADRTRWTPVAAALAARFTFYLMDRRGRGLSGDSDSDYGIEVEAQDVAAVVEAIRVPVMLLGHSYGAVCALEAGLMTAGISRMLLYEPPAASSGTAVVEPDVLERMQSLLAIGDRAGVLETFMREVVHLDSTAIKAMKGTPVWNARLDAVHTIVRESRAANDYKLDPSRLHSLAVPVRFLTGTDSPGWLRAATAAFHAAVPHSDVVELKGQAHTMDTAPDLFVDEVIRFAPKR